MHHVHKPREEQVPLEVLREKKNDLIRRFNWRRLLVSLTVTALMTLLLFGYVFGIAIVNGSSMNPSYRNKDLILFYRLGSYKKDDVIILQSERDLLRKYVKRIIGQPGDKVEINEDGYVLLNGEALEEPYAVGATHRGNAIDYPVLLEENEYFVLGDNRENSHDSRNFGKISDSQIDGKIVVVFRTGNEFERN